MHHANINDSMAKSTPDYGQHMLKSEHGPIPAGAHWITVHGGGGSGKGTPILVMPHEDGSMRVIGGAGGALIRQYFPAAFTSRYMPFSSASL